MHAQRTGAGLARREVLRGSAIGAVLAGGRGTARAAPRQLRILQWKHFVPSYDHWFDTVFAREWGIRNDVEVVVDHVGLGDLDVLIRAEAAAGRGHDIVFTLSPPALLEDHAIDHGAIYAEVERRHGPMSELARRTTFNPRTGRHVGFCWAFSPAVLTYRRSLWDSVAVEPTSWPAILAGGRRIRLLHDRTVGLGLAPEHNGEHSLRAIMYAFGAGEQDADGNPALRSKAMLEVLHFVEALFAQAMTAEVLGWDAASNNRSMLSGEISLTLDTLSIVRSAETTRLPLVTDLHLAPMPEGPLGRIGPPFGFYTYLVWKFAEHRELAERFLVDHAGALRDGLLASGFQNMPNLPSAVPDLAAVLAADPGSVGAGKYAALAGSPDWSVNFGYPGYSNVAIGEVYARGVLPRLVARVVTGRASAEAALDDADAEVRAIFARFREEGRI